METGFAVTAFLALILHLLLPEEVDDEVVDITADDADERNDEQEWERIRRPSGIRRSIQTNSSAMAETDPKSSNTDAGDKEIKETKEV